MACQACFFEKRQAAAPATRMHRPNKGLERTKIAIEFISWREGEGKGSKQPHVDFMLTKRFYKNDVVPKADKEVLKRALKRHSGTKRFRRPDG